MVVVCEVADNSAKKSVPNRPSRIQYGSLQIPSKRPLADILDKLPDFFQTLPKSKRIMDLRWEAWIVNRTTSLALEPTGDRLA